MSNLKKSFSKAIKLNGDYKPSLWSKFKKNFSIGEVRTAEQFFSLPKSEREFFGFYKVPYSLPSNIFGSSFNELGWEYYWQEIKNEYPFQYFFRHYLPSLDNPLVFAWHKWIFWPFREFRIAFSLFLKPVCPRWRKVLPRHQYNDVTNLVVKANLAMILDFYHEEVVDGFVDWQGDEVHKKFHKELTKHVEWIEKTSKEWDVKLGELLDEASKNPKCDKKGNFLYKATYGKYNTLEEKVKNKETEILNWFVENREFFWT